jgi:hypothetical protein
MHTHCGGLIYRRLLQKIFKLAYEYKFDEKIEKRERSSQYDIVISK